MKRVFTICAVVLLLALAGRASATPVSGYWWNPAEGGRGYVIEIQGSSLFLTGFLYDASGRATWVESIGTMSSTTQYSGSLFSYSGGQSLNGAFQVATQSAAIGTVSITFTSDTQASLTWPGGTVPIQRFDFGPGGAGASQPSGNPQAGYWWNSAEGGRGYTVEVQGGTLYFAAFMYDPSGNPLWYLASGPLAQGQTFQGSLTQYGNGQTLTGGYQAASVVNANVGAITLQFTDSADAVLTLPTGRQIPLTRFSFGATTAQNVQAMVVDAGPVSNAVNVGYISITLCAPGGGNCQAIDHVAVDTGSSGLRIVSSVLSPALAQALRQQNDASARPVAECLQFQGGYAWGPVKLADLTIAGELAQSLPIQVIGDAAYPSVPADCASAGAAQNTVAALGANGIIGLGVFQSDCGANCATGVVPGTYYACPASGCINTQLAVASQVQNPVGLFAVDNNGVIIQLPAISPTGEVSVSGTLTFGIATQANNNLGVATVMPVDPRTGYLSALVNGQTYPNSYVSSGGSAILLPAAMATVCGGDYAPFFCPVSTLNISGTLLSANGTTSAVATFSVANAQTLGASQPTFAAFNDLAAVNGDSAGVSLGLPFFYGRRVLTAIEGKGTPYGSGPWVAY